jgi:hypothetical protein
MRQWSAAGGDIQYGQHVAGGAALVQRHEHMIETVPGELGSDPEWGIGARALLGRTTVGVDTEGLAATYRAQHLRDPETAEVEATIEYDGQRLTYAATITPNEGVEEELQVVIE